jgi:hypothetical protein
MELVKIWRTNNRAIVLFPPAVTKINNHLRTLANDVSV